MIQGMQNSYRTVNNMLGNACINIHNRALFKINSTIFCILVFIIATAYVCVFEKLLPAVHKA